MKDQSRTNIYNTEGILEQFEGFYRSLYSTKCPNPEKIDDYMMRLTITELSADHKTFMEQPITVEEISQTIKSLKTNKAQGLDGYTAEFYKIMLCC